MKYCGREFSEQELTIIRELCKKPGLLRAHISREICREFNWLKPDGGLKDMSCRVALLRMEKDGLIKQPAPSMRKPIQRKIIFTEKSDRQETITEPVNRLPQLKLMLVKKPTDSKLWNEYIERYHYLGHKTLPGAQLRYFVTADSTILALLGFGAAAWQTAPRDNFIGWTHEQRQQNLHLIVNNARFLILPWVQSKNLASKILSLIAKRLPIDWLERYKYQPVLMETFVETQRFAGTCYKAANWIYVGKTKGRGKLGPRGKQSVPIKDLWLYPLKPSFRSALTQ